MLPFRHLQLLHTPKPPENLQIVKEGEKNHLNKLINLHGYQYLNIGPYLGLSLVLLASEQH